MAKETNAPQQARPGSPAIPVVQRKESIQERSVPNIQAAYEGVAKSDTLMSDIGAHVAQTASNAMAEELGYTAGLNPHGNLLPSFTEFDKHFAQTYNTQASATLGNQIQDLFNKAHIEMSKAPQLTPELIESTNRQLLEGLNRISAQAPTAVKADLQHKYRGLLSTQDAQYKEKMFSQQRDEQKNNLITLIDTNNKNIYETAKSGDFGTAERMLKVNEANIQNALDNKFISPQQAEAAKDNSRQNLINAQYNFGATGAHKIGKAGQYLKTLADNKPGNLTNEQYEKMLDSTLKQVQFLDSLVAQDQNLKTQQMLNQIAAAPSAITQAQWDDFSNNVSPVQAEKVKFSYIQAIKKNQTDNSARDNLIAHYDNAEIQAMADPKVKDAAFWKQVGDAVQNSTKTTIPMKSPKPLSLEEAEVQVATSAGAEIPAFTKLLKNKLASSNPQVSDLAAQQIHALLQNGNGQALKGLNDQDWSMFSAIQALRDSPDPVKANQDAHNRIYNQDPEVERINKSKWSSILSKQNSNGIANDTFALKTFHMDKSDFINPTLATAYGANILNKLSNYFAISGDFNEAKTSTQRWVDENYGNTFINGGKFMTLHPIEKVVGFSGRDGVPYIQQDMINQFNEKLLPIKKQYDEGKVNEHWEMIPVENKNTKEENLNILKQRALHNYQFEHAPLTLHDENPSNTLMEGLAKATHRELTKNQPTEKTSQQHGIFLHTYDPVKIKRVTRKEGVEKSEIFNVVLIGNSFGKYDVGLQGQDGMTNLFREAPHLGISDYSPNIDAIKSAYNKHH
jgi:hypothetical protein